MMLSRHVPIFIVALALSMYAMRISVIAWALPVVDQMGNQTGTCTGNECVCRSYMVKWRNAEGNVWGSDQYKTEAKARQAMLLLQNESRNDNSNLTYKFPDGPYCVGYEGTTGQARLQEGLERLQEAVEAVDNAQHLLETVEDVIHHSPTNTERWAEDSFGSPLEEYTELLKQAGEQIDSARAVLRQTERYSDAVRNMLDRASVDAERAQSGLSRIQSAISSHASSSRPCISPTPSNRNPLPTCPP